MTDFFYMDLCAFIILSILIISNFLKKMWSGLTNTIHSIIHCVCLCSIFFHILFFLCSYYGRNTTFNYVFMNVVYYLYLLCLSYIHPLVTVYVFASIGIWYSFLSNKKNIIILIVIASLPFLLLSGNFFQGYLYTISKDGTLTYTNLYFLIYVLMDIFLLFNLIITFCYRKYLLKIQLIIGLIGYPLNFAAIIIQALFPDLNFLLFFIAATCYLVSTTIQRPELLLSPYAKAKSYFSFYADTEKLVSLGNPCNFLFIKIVNHKNIKTYLGKRNYSNFLSTISRTLFKFCKENKIQADIYYLGRSSFCVPSQISSIKELAAYGRQLSNYFKHELKVNNLSIFVDARISIAQFPEDIYNFEYLKYFARDFHNIVPKTKDIIIISDYTSDKQFKVRNEIDFILDKAFKENNFDIYYQPIYSKIENRFISAEAFVRLKDPELGDISPSVFIPYAENSDLIYRITDFAFESVSRFISSSEFKMLNLKHIDINLSTSQCIDPELTDKISKYLTKYQISPDKIRLQITEAAVDINPEVVENNIEILKKQGILFALDNYGTGYSNIKRLITLPLDVVIFDRTFISEYRNSKIKIILENTIKMLMDLNKKILVQGIEDRETSEYFKNLNCDLLQGYYFSRPLPRDAFVKYISDIINNHNINDF